MKLRSFVPAGLMIGLILSIFIVLPLSAQSSPADPPLDFIMSMRPSRLELNPLYTISSLEAQVYTAIYEGLVSYDPVNLRPLPAVAQRWEVLEEGRLYRFFLNSDARYWNGQPVKSADIREAWLKMLSLGDDAPFGFLLDPIRGAEAFRRGETSDPASVGINAPEDGILEVELYNPAAHFLSILAHQSLVAIHPDQLETRNWNSLEQPMGNGPYRISEKRNDRIVMERNPHYWDRENSRYDRIIIEFNDDNRAATARFNAGDIQWLYSGFLLSELRIPNSLQITPQFATSYYLFSAEQTPFDDQRIRRALTLLLPLSEIRSEDTYFVPTANLIPQIPGYPDVQGISEGNREEAFALLRDAGYENGVGLPVVRIVLTDSDESRRIADLMSNAWSRELDLRVETEFLEYNAHQDRMRRGDFTIGTISWIADYADPLSFLQMWTTGSNVNNAGFSDSRFDELIDQSYLTAGTERFQLLAEAEEYLLQSAALIPVSHSPAWNVIDLEAVGGWHPNPLDIHPFKYLFRRTLTAPSNVAVLQ